MKSSFAGLKKRFKWLFQAFFRVGGYIRVLEGSFVKTRLGFASLVIVSVLILTPFSPIAAADHATRVISFLSSGVKTAATVQTSAFEVSAYTEGQIFVDVTVEASTSTLDITIQTSPDNITWFTHTAMTQITGTGQYRQAITNFGKYVRLSYTVGGTSYTFSVTGVFKN
ncbi:MAG: hypothetical protein ABSC54_00835 [Smithellaceae bacterium]|jgi:hypothetical protein